MAAVLATASRYSIFNEAWRLCQAGKREDPLHVELVLGQLHRLMQTYLFRLAMVLHLQAFSAWSKEKLVLAISDAIRFRQRMLRVKG